MVIHKLSPEKRQTATWWILASAQIAFVTGSLLDRFASEPFSFLVGLLTGFAVVGNIYFISQYKTLKYR